MSQEEMKERYILESLENPHFLIFFPYRQTYCSRYQNHRKLWQFFKKKIVPKQKIWGKTGYL